MSRRAGNPSLTMTRTSRALSLIVVLCAATSALAAPAHSQGDQQVLQTEEALLRQQELRRDELTALIAGKEAALGGLGDEIFELADTIAVNNTGLEFLADKLEETVDERREPEATRVEIALISFRRGDPRQGGLVDEFRVLENRGEAAQRRVLYESVISEAARRLEEINIRLQELRNQLFATRQLVDESQDQIDQRRTSQQQLTDEIAAAEAELETTLLEIQNTNIRIGNEHTQKPRALLTGLTIDAQVSRPALAVKVDNVRAAMPQSGINQADIVYVEEVEGATRLAAVFHSTAPAEVGPVRSMRTGDFDLLAQLNSPLFANSGGNRGTRAALAQSTLADIGVGDCRTPLLPRLNPPGASQPLHQHRQSLVGRKRIFQCWSATADLRVPGTGRTGQFHGSAGKFHRYRLPIHRSSIHLERIGLGPDTGRPPDRRHQGRAHQPGDGDRPVHELWALSSRLPVARGDQRRQRHGPGLHRRSCGGSHLVPSEGHRCDGLHRQRRSQHFDPPGPDVGRTPPPRQHVVFLTWILTGTPPRGLRLRRAPGRGRIRPLR